jgi:hypothetical protein
MLALIEDTDRVISCILCSRRKSDDEGYRLMDLAGTDILSFMVF